MAFMITITSQEAAAFANADPIIKSFIDIDLQRRPTYLTPIDESMGWACHLLAEQLKSLNSILSVGSNTGDELMLTTILAMKLGLSPGRLVCVVEDQEPLNPRKHIAEDAAKRQVPDINILCGDLSHKATFFQAQEFGPYDILFLSTELRIDAIHRWCKLIKDGGFFVMSEAIERKIGEDMTDPEIQVGGIKIRRKV